MTLMHSAYCDRCYKDHKGRSSFLFALIHDLERSGWYVEEDMTMCPDCRKEAE